MLGEYDVSDKKLADRFGILLQKNDHRNQAKK